MPPRFAYWTILIDGKPTAFRSRDQQELLPTITQLKRTNQDVVLKWFARGRLWESQEAERAAERRPAFTGEKRGADWRPGGAHKDPRDRFKKKHRPERAWSPGDQPVRRDRPWSAKPPGPRKPWNAKPAGGQHRPWESKPSGPRKPWTQGARGEGKPWSSKPPGERKPWSSKPSGERKPWSPKPPGDRRPWGARPSGGDKPWGGHPAGPRKPWGAKPSGPRKPWRDRPDDRKRRDDKKK